MSKRCVVCDDNPGTVRDPSGEWWCATCTRTAAEFAVYNEVSLDIARETLHATVKAWNGIDDMTATEFDKAFSEGEPVKIVTGPPVPGYTEQTNMTLTMEDIAILNRKLSSNAYPRYKRRRNR